jgi:hypothetical protein
MTPDCLPDGTHSHGGLDGKTPFEVLREKLTSKAIGQAMS